MTDDLLCRMAQCVRSKPCTCEFERNAGGVPLWFPAECGGIERHLLRECSRCLLLKEYDGLVNGIV